MKLVTKRASTRPIALTAAFVVASAMATDGLAFDATQNPHPTNFGFVVMNSKMSDVSKALDPSGIPDCGSNGALTDTGSGFTCMTPAKGDTGAQGPQGSTGPAGPSGGGGSVPDIKSMLQIPSQYDFGYPNDFVCRYNTNGYRMTYQYYLMVISNWYFRAGWSNIPDQVLVTYSSAYQLSSSDTNQTGLAQISGKVIYLASNGSRYGNAGFFSEEDGGVCSPVDSNLKPVSDIRDAWQP